MPLSQKIQEMDNITLPSIEHHYLILLDLRSKNSAHKLEPASTFRGGRLPSGIEESSYQISSQVRFILQVSLKKALSVGIAKRLMTN